jgi:hypothetical protein
MWTWESSGTPESSEFYCKGQNTPHRKVLYIIGKLSKFRCPKWDRMTHLDICNTSYGQKQGWESNWQFDSRPWKVGNRPDSLACRWHPKGRWKAFDEGYNFGSNLISIGGLYQKLYSRKVAGLPYLAFGCQSRGMVQSILYGGRWWLPPSPGHGESYESKVAYGLS